MESYLIGDLLIHMDYGGMPVLPDGNLQLFRYAGPWSGDTITFRGSFEPLGLHQKEILRGDNRVYEIYRHNEENLLVYHWGNLFHGFAVWPDRFAVSYSPEMRNQPALRQDWFFSICSFHRQLLIRNACVLHSSCVNVDGSAVLFTGRSNMGKSTQAELWRKHAGAEVINGDRTLIRMRDGVLNAFGYPCCGTSGICINKTLPIKAIVVLEKSQDNKVLPLSKAQKIRALVSATEIYPWDKFEMEQAFAIAEMISSNVPVVKLACRADVQAVDVLKEYLEEKDHAKRI